MAAKIEVVIVGGGSGAILARKLSAARKQFDPTKYSLTLISSLPYHVHLLGAARMTVTSEQSLDTTQKALIPFDHLFAPGHAGRFLQGDVINVLDDHLELADGSSVRYDYLVLATGSLWTGPVDFSGKDDILVQKHINSWRESVGNAQEIVVVGGGSVGIASQRCIFRDAAASRMKKAGVDLILGERISSIPLSSHGLHETEKELTSITTDKGKIVSANLFIPAVGAKPNTSLLSSFRGGEALTPSGFVRVTPTLNVHIGAHKTNVIQNIWAIGDIVDIEEQHMLAKANAHGDVVFKNVLAALNGGKLIQYKGFMEAIFITAGPKGGLGFLPFLWGIILGDWIVPWVKSAGLFVSYARKAYGFAS